MVGTYKQVPTTRLTPCLQPVPSHSSCRIYPSTIITSYPLSSVGRVTRLQRITDNSIAGKQSGYLLGAEGEGATGDELVTFATACLCTLKHEMRGAKCCCKVFSSDTSINRHRWFIFVGTGIGTWTQPMPAIFLINVKRIFSFEKNEKLYYINIRLIIWLYKLLKIVF